MWGSPSRALLRHGATRAGSAWERSRSLTRASAEKRARKEQPRPAPAAPPLQPATRHALVPRALVPSPTCTPAHPHARMPQLPRPRFARRIRTPPPPVARASSPGPRVRTSASQSLPCARPPADAVSPHASTDLLSWAAADAAAVCPPRMTQKQLTFAPPMPPLRPFAGPAFSHWVKFVWDHAHEATKPREAHPRSPPSSAHSPPPPTPTPHPRAAPLSAHESDRFAAQSANSDKCDKKET